jgi:hypothetical protein
MEGVARAHVLDVHCGETAPELVDRLRFEPKVRAASTFRDQATAQAAVQDVIDANQEAISGWLAAGKPPVQRFKFVADGAVGKVLTRKAWYLGERPVDTRRMRIVLQLSSASPTGFVVHTAFPELTT